MFRHTLRTPAQPLEGCHAAFRKISDVGPIFPETAVQEEIQRLEGGLCLPIEARSRFPGHLSSPLLTWSLPPKAMQRDIHFSSSCRTEEQDRGASATRRAWLWVGWAPPWTRCSWLVAGGRVEAWL